jgi:hypothetical protein
VLVKENQSAYVYNPPRPSRWPAIALGLAASGICCLALLKLLPGIELAARGQPTPVAVGAQPPSTLANIRADSEQSVLLANKEEATSSPVFTRDARAMIKRAPDARRRQAKKSHRRGVSPATYSPHYGPFWGNYSRRSNGWSFN